MKVNKQAETISTEERHYKRMSYINTEEYLEQINTLTVENDKISNENLIEQQKRFQDLNTDLLQSIQLLVSDYPELVSIIDKNTSSSNDDDDRFIDFECLDDKIIDFNKIILSLRMIYLEQESLDNFLRYTISSTTKDLPITSIEDPKLIAVEEEVKHLENEVIVTRQTELSDIKRLISEKSVSMFNDDCKIKELCIETSEQIEECERILEEINTLQRAKREKGKRESQDKITKISKTYGKWQNIKRLESTNEKLLRQIESCIKQKQSIGDSKATEGESISQSSIVIKYKAVKVLIKLLQKELLPRLYSNIHNIEIDSITNSITLQRIGTDTTTETIRLQLDNSFALSQVEISKNPLLEKSLMQQFYGECNIYKIIKYINELGGSLS